MIIHETKPDGQRGPDSVTERLFQIKMVARIGRCGGAIDESDSNNHQASYRHDHAPFDPAFPLVQIRFEHAL